MIDLEVWVDKNDAAYYNDTLENCIKSGDCTLATKMTLNYFLNLPIQMSKDL